jgi:hypothetical protein
MDNKTKAFRSHLFSKFYQYILTHDYFNAYLQSEEGQHYDPEEFYATAIPELLRNLKNNYELDKHYRLVIGSLPIEERPAIQNFMAWFNVHQDDGFREIYAAQAYDQSYDFRPILELMELTITREFAALEADPQTGDDALDKLFRIIEHFTSASASILKRRKGKPELRLEDEYDMQDLLLIMLRAQFPSVQSEQVTQGSADRQFLKIDFLIPDSKIALECKFYDGKPIKSLTEELDIDIQSYHRHADCRNLVFFIYDKKQQISDVNGLEKRYEQQQTFDGKPLNIYLKIRPKN